MVLEPQDVKAVIGRLKRAHGHLATVIWLLEDGAQCEGALIQLAAVTKAISRGGYALIATGLQQCVADGKSLDGADIKRMEKLVLSLA